MAIFGKKGGGLFGSVVGFALALAAAPATGGLSLQTLATYTSIGFTIGNFLFPPEFDDEDEEHTAPEVSEGGSIPLIFGTHISRGVLSYFDVSHIKSQKDGDYEKLYWAPMQMVVCICEDFPVNDPYGSLYLPGLSDASGNFLGWQSDTGRYISVKALDEEGEPVASYPYFPQHGPEALKSLLNTFEGDVSDIAEAIEGITVLSGNQITPESTDLGIDVLTKSWPQISWGGNPIDMYDQFTDPEWAPNLFKFDPDDTSKEDFSDYWSEDLPPMKNMLTMSSPVWPLGRNASTAPSWRYLVSGLYPSEPGAIYLEVLTNKLWGMGMDVDTELNEETFTGSVSSFQLANIDDGFAINANVSSQSGKSLIEKLNFHMGTILREDHLGRLELLAIRSLAEGPTYTQQNYIDWIDAGSPDSGGPYYPGFPVLFEVRDEDSSDVQVSNQLWATVYSSFVAKFKNAEANYTDSTVVVRNAATENLLGGPRDKSFTFNMFTDVDSATTRLLQLSNEKSRPGLILRQDLPASYFGIRVGDGIRQWNSVNKLEGVYLRVASVDTSKIGDNTISVECTLDHASLFAKSLLTVDVQVPGQGKEPEIPDDPHDPQAISAHPDFWDHNLSYDDASATGTNDKKTHIYVAPGSAQQSSHRDFSIEGVLNPYVGTPIPAIAKGTQESSTWSLSFTLLSALAEGSHLCSHDDYPVLIQLSGYKDQDISAMLATKTASNWETDSTVLVIQGRPFANPSSSDSENVVEVLRFRTLELVSGDIYRLKNVVRQANKGQAAHWPAGTAAWITDLSEVTKDASLPYDLWPNRSLAQAKADASIDEGSHRVRLFTQSITLSDASGNEEGTGFVQPETEGLSITYDALNSAFFSGEEYHDAKIPPMPNCSAVRIGDVPQGKGLWYRLPVDGVTNLLADAYDLSAWTIAGATITQTSGSIGLGYAPSNLSLTELSWPLAGAGAAVSANLNVSSGLTDGLDYSMVLHVRLMKGDSANIYAELIGDGSATFGGSYVIVNWDGTITTSGGVSNAYYIGNDALRIHLTATRTGGNDLFLRTLIDTASTGDTEVGFGEVLVYEGTDEALFTEDDWIVQFPPMGDYGGIGDQSISVGTGGATEWGTFLDDDDEDDIPTNQVGSLGTYKVFVQYEDVLGLSSPLTLSGSSTETLTVGSGDQWPSFIVAASDMSTAGSSDAPSISTHFHPKQLQFRVAKQGSGGYYGPQTRANVKAPWPQDFVYDS